MTDLEALSVAVPRSDSLCAQFASRIAPAWGFVLAFFIVIACVLVAALVVALKLSEMLEMGVLGPAIVCVVVGETVAIFALRFWRRTRRRAVETLIREGELIEVTVLRSWWVRGARWYDLEAPGRTLTCHINPGFDPAGDTFTMLLDRHVRLAVAFDSRGKMFAGEKTLLSSSFGR